MDYSKQVAVLEKRVDELRSAAQGAAGETHDQLKQRIDQAHADSERALQSAQQQAATVGADAQDDWAQMKADASAKIADLKRRIDKRGAQIDAKTSAASADWAEFGRPGGAQLRRVGARQRPLRRALGPRRASVRRRACPGGDERLSFESIHFIQAAAPHNPGVTEIVKIPNRGHSLTIDHGWREVAETALAFVKRFA